LPPSPDVKRKVSEVAFRQVVVPNEADTATHLMALTDAIAPTLGSS
jgi:hypothetical protein